MPGAPHYQHGRRHAPWGDDPYDAVSWARATGVTSHSQTTDSYALDLDNYASNDNSTFELHGDGDGINVKRAGLYWIRGKVGVGAGDIAVTRTAYVQADLESSYPTFGNEFGAQYSIDISSIVQSASNGCLQLVHDSVGAIGGTAAAPYKVIVASIKGTPSGTNFTILGASSGLFIVRLCSNKTV